MPGMAFRITTSARKVTTLKIDGEFTREGIAELEKACASVDGPVDLDLSQLMKADAEGVRALKNVLRARAKITSHFDSHLRAIFDCGETAEILNVRPYASGFDDSAAAESDPNLRPQMGSYFCAGP